MALTEDSGTDQTGLVFQRRWQGWVLVGGMCVALAAVHMGTDMHMVLTRYIGARGSHAIWFALGAGGALLMLVGALTFCEYTMISEAAIEQRTLGHPLMRMLWMDVERVTVYRHKKGGTGLVELRSKAARTLTVDRRLRRFEELVDLILERADSFGAEIRDQR